MNLSTNVQTPSIYFQGCHRPMQLNNSMNISEYAKACPCMIIPVFPQGFSENIVKDGRRIIRVSRMYEKKSSPSRNAINNWTIASLNTLARLN